MFLSKAITTCATLLSANLVQATPVTIDFYGDYLGNAPVEIEDFNIPNVVTISSNMYPAAYVFADKFFSGLSFTTGYGPADFLRMDFTLPIYSLTIDTDRVGEGRYIDAIKETGSLNGIAYKDGNETQLLDGILDEKDRSFTFVSNNSIGFSTVIFFPISPIIYFFDYDTETIEGSGYRGSGIDSVSFDTAAPIPEPETYAMLLSGLGLLGGIAKKRKEMT